MLTIIIRSILIYFIVLFVYRLMGKRQLGQMQPFVPVLHGVVPLLTLVVMHFILTILTKSSQFLSKLISGKPSIIINPKGIDYNAMKKLNLSTDDIFAALRECGYFSISQVQYAIMETNGKVSVMPKSEAAPATNADLKLDVDESFIPIVLVSEGKIMKDNVNIARLDEGKVFDLVAENGGKGGLKKVLILTVDQSGNGYIQMMDDEGKSFQTKELASA